MDNTVEKIYKAGLKLLVPSDLEHTYKLIVVEALKLVKAQEGTILLLEGDHLKRVWASNPILYGFEPRKRGHTYQVFKTHKPIISSGVEIENIHPQMKKLGIKSHIAI